MRLVSALVVVLCLSLFPAVYAGVADPGASGPYPLGHMSLLVVDTSRSADSTFGGRPVPINIWYPADAAAITEQTPEAAYQLDSIYGQWPASYSSHWEPFGISRAYENVPVAAGKPFPLVVVSPGWGARWYGLLFYAQRLASHGFIVALTQHYRDGALGWDPRDPLDVALFNRPRDVSFMLDTLLSMNADSASVLFGSMRPDLVAASGWSLGGYAAMALVAGDDEVCGSPDDPLPPVCQSLGVTAPDRRIKAIVPLDGSNQCLHFSELARITVPSLGIGQEWAHVEDWQARQHAAVSGLPHYRVDIANALHGSFSNSCITPHVLHALGLITDAQLATQLTAPPCTTAITQAEVNRLAAKYAIAFLKTHLAAEPGYQNILTPGWALTRESDIEFFVTEKRDANAVDEDWPGFFMYFMHQPGSAQARAERDPVRARPVERVEW